MGEVARPAAAVGVLGVFGVLGAAVACRGDDTDDAAALADDPLAVVDAWNEARNDGDVERAMALVADDALLVTFAMDDPAERATWLDLLDAQAIAGWQIDESCELHSGGWVACTYVQSDELLRSWGLALRGTHDYTVRDGHIEQLDRRHDADTQREVYDAVDDFRAWAESYHPDVAAVIWTDPSVTFYSDARGADAAMSLVDEFDEARAGD